MLARRVIPALARSLKPLARPVSTRAASTQCLSALSAVSRRRNGCYGSQILSSVHFSTDAATPPADDVMDENRFLTLAENTLNDILGWIDGVEEMLEDSDITLSQGVLKIDLGEHGTWVINRQIPNRQIWWSSPVSGPRRYEYDVASGEWCNTRDGTEMIELLRNEIADQTGIQIFQ
ncbi:TPA: hypothetical protein N0F65_000941 [Lagenidium giganteum]|uniref:ferroxidase n=1 Tax=Lagenidium giganteum TaxID=4803 RepID=A0AAV2YL76_9STRA|nr:TPA: hypothetical protein N0F65_000941 [Lagenidium giganteum]